MEIILSYNNISADMINDQFSFINNSGKITRAPIIPKGEKGFFYGVLSRLIDPNNLKHAIDFKYVDGDEDELADAKDGTVLYNKQETLIKDIRTIKKRLDQVFNAKIEFCHIESIGKGNQKRITRIVLDKEFVENITVYEGNHQIIKDIRKKIQDGAITIDEEALFFDDSHFSKRETISRKVDHILSFLNRVTIFGEDGSGKSTFIKHYIIEHNGKGVIIPFNDTFILSIASLRLSGMTDDIYSSLYKEYSRNHNILSYIFVVDNNSDLDKIKNEEEFRYYINVFLLKKNRPDYIVLDDFPVYTKEVEHMINKLIQIMPSVDYSPKLIVTTNREPTAVSNRILLDHNSVDLNDVFLLNLELPDRIEKFYQELNNGDVKPVFDMLGNNVCAIVWLANYMRSTFENGEPVTFRSVRRKLTEHGELVSSSNYEYYDTTNELLSNTNSFLGYLNAFIHIENLPESKLLLLLCMAGKAISKELFLEICLKVLDYDMNSFNYAIGELYRNRYLTVDSSYYRLNPIIKMMIAPEFDICHDEIFTAFMKSFEIDDVDALVDLLSNYQNSLDSMIKTVESPYDVIDLILIIINLSLVTDEISTGSLKKLIQVIRKNSLTFSYELNRKLYYLYKRTGAKELERFEDYYYISDILDKNKQFIYSSDLAKSLLDELIKHDPNGDDSSWNIDENHFVKYSMGLIYSMIIANGKNIPTLKPAYEKFLSLRETHLSTCKLTDTVNGILNSDIGALYLNLGKNYSDFSDKLTNDDINSRMECYSRAKEYHTKAKVIRYSLLQKEPDSIDKLKDYAQSVETIATDLYYMGRFDDSIKERKDLLNNELIKKNQDVEPLKHCVFTMYKNIAGSYAKIHEASNRALLEEEIKFCISILSKAIDYFDKDTNDYEDVCKKYEIFTNMKSLNS